MVNNTDNSALKKLATITLVVVMAAGLSSCGRRGALQAPASAQIDSADTKSDNSATKSTKPDKKFILDGLI